MTYDDLKNRALRGDGEAAEQLLPLARAKRDGATILVCWQQLYSARHSAWKALEATQRALVTNGHGLYSDGEPAFDTTQQLQQQVVAVALVDGCRRKFDTLEPIAQALLDLARSFLEDDRAAHLAASDPTVLLALQRKLREILVCDDDQRILEMIGAARALFEAPAA